MLEFFSEKNFLCLLVNFIFCYFYFVSDLNETLKVLIAP